MTSYETQDKGITYAVIVPTLNGGILWKQWLAAFRRQGISADNVLIIDSSSDDDTADMAAAEGMRVEYIRRRDFDHGGTRQFGVQLAREADVLVFLTQDAIVSGSDTVKKLVEVFHDASVGAAYGRQLPHHNAKPLGAHARLFNYPEISAIRSRDDISQYGIKTAFLSNSFAAYRRIALEAVGGFPTHLILGEDMTVAARMLLKGWRIAYVGEAQVFHSHDYTMGQEFRRYFDIGVFHSRQDWLLETFGRPEGEGERFVRSELSYLWKHAPWLVPSAMVRTLLKYAGYRLGRMERRLPRWLKLRCSMHKGFWQDRSEVTAPVHSK